MTTRRTTPYLRGLALCMAFLLLSVLAACGGGGGGGGGTVAAPSNLGYATDPGIYRAAEAIPDNPPTVSGGAVAAYSVAPMLPTGLSLHPTTGVISGTPMTQSGSTAYTVTATNAGGSTQAAVTIAIGLALPLAFVSLRAGFQAEPVATTPSLSRAAKMVMAPDGRMFVIELDTGLIRWINAAGALQGAAYIDLSSIMIGAPAAQWDIAGGGHQGLFGLVLHPDFTNNGFLYVAMSITDAATSLLQKTVLLRFTDDVMNNVATNQQTVLDDLPTANINNGGELVFDTDGVSLFVTVGDVTDATNAQADIMGGIPSTLAGKILRINPTTPATVPASNASGTFEYVRGIRNSYGMALHPTTGGLFATDAEGADPGTGLSMVDEINLIVEGKNFEWGAADGTIAGADAGFTVWDSPATTITPLSLAWHTGAGFSTATTDTLLVGWYNATTGAGGALQRIRQMVMTGPVRGDVDSESDFATMVISPDGNQPLDLCVDSTNGDIYVTLFSGIYRISAIP